MNRMFRRTQHLAVIVAGIGMLGGLAATAPMAGAQPNQTVSDQTCTQWKGWYDDDTKAADKAKQAHNQQAADQAAKDAAYDKKLAKDGGCGWATAARATGLHAQVNVNIRPTVVKAKSTVHATATHVAGQAR
jgi:hypothetical protein